MRKDPHAKLKTVSAETKDILEELEKEYKAPEVKEVKKEVNWLSILVNYFIYLGLLIFLY